MVFSSITFIFCFLPVFLLLYYLIPNRRVKDIILVAGSLFFYAWGEPVYVILMLFSMGFNYFMALDIWENPDDRKRKASMIFTVVINLLILGFFKYYGFLLDSVAALIRTPIAHPVLSLPIGISFYTFKNLSYLLDVYSQKVDAQPDLLTFAVYSTMFPHMSAGPIVRYADIEEQLYQRTISFPKLGLGMEMFIKGLAKKVILADNLALIFSEITQTDGKIAVVTAWIGIFAYTLEIYLDFSGYSDMAIGLGKMLGFDFKKNFDYPYISTSVTEFWRRWHISLGSWFRDYVYIPLGGNRVSTGKHIRNILIVWALTGLWHGASWNFVLWGVYYGILLLLEKFILASLLENLPGFVRNLLTMLAVMIGWVFFSIPSFSAIFRYLGSMFGIGASAFLNGASLYYLRTGIVLFIVGTIVTRPNPQIRFKRLMRTKPRAAVVLDILLFAAAVAYLVANSYTPFLYQQF